MPTPNEAAAYIASLVSALKTGDKSIVKLKKSALERIGTILTGLQVASTPRFRKTLNISDEAYQKLVSGLRTTPGAADYAVKIGSRLPSVRTEYVDGVSKFSKNAPEIQTEFLKKLETLQSSVGGSSPPK